MITTLALFKARTRIQIGNGQRARFWTDNWLAGGRSVQDVFPTFFSYIRDSDISVAAALNQRRWDRDIRGGMSTQVIAQYLQLWDLIELTIEDLRSWSAAGCVQITRGCQSGCEPVTVCKPQRLYLGPFFLP
jgi:hypothetical protein